MLRISEITKSYSTQVLFSDLSLVVAPGEKIGLVGRNGHGKTTLFRLIVGEEHPDSGSIILPRDYRVGYLSQHIAFTKDSVLEEACLALSEQESDLAYKAKAILLGLGFSENEFSQSPLKLSGGYQVRLNLAKILIAEPNLLLLDEPTNYLDIVSMRWLERFLRDWAGELLLITHDRNFMDSVATHIVGIHRQKARKVAGNTEKYFQQLSQEEEVHEKTRLNQERKVKDVERFIERFRAKASKATVVQSRVKLLDKMERVEKLSAIDDLEFSFNATSFPGRWLLEAERISFSYGSSGPQLIKELSLAIAKNDRIGVIGRNGRGKTTLLNLLAGDLTPSGGDIKTSPNVEMGYFGQTNILRLNLKNTVAEEISSVDDQNNQTRVRSICGLMMFSGEAADKPISVLSGGERSRVLLGKILVKKANLLLLDEPTNHLDMYSAEALLEAIEDFPGAIVLVTHNEEFLHRVVNKLVVFDRNEILIFPGGYQDFLDQVGWAEEDNLRSNKKLNGDKLSKKELRRERAQRLQEKNNVLNPLKKQIENLEADITKLEKAIAADETELAELFSGGYSGKARILSDKIDGAKKKIDRLFLELEKVNKAYEQKSAEYAD